MFQDFGNEDMLLDRCPAFDVACVFQDRLSIVVFSQHALACRSPRINSPPPPPAAGHFIPILIG
jgi:hypothetical protein